MTKNWKENLASFFEGYRIIERSKEETLKNFDQFCEFVAEPAFENLQEELKNYRDFFKDKKIQRPIHTFQINFPKVPDRKLFLHNPLPPKFYRAAVEVGHQRTKKQEKLPGGKRTTFYERCRAYRSHENQD